MGARSNLALRVLSACIFVPAILALSWAGGLALLALVLAIVGRGSWEFFRLARDAGHRPMAGLGIGLSLGLSLYLYLRGPVQLELVLGTSLILCLLAALRHGVEGYGSRVWWTLGGVVYLGLLGSAPLILVRQVGQEQAGWLLITLFWCIWLTDSAAYFCGRFWGKRKLAPGISPAKTVAGFVGGTLGGLVPLAFSPQLPFLGTGELAGLLCWPAWAARAGIWSSRLSNATWGSRTPRP